MLSPRGAESNWVLAAELISAEDEQLSSLSSQQRDDAFVGQALEERDAVGGVRFREGQDLVERRELPRRRVGAEHIDERASTT
jgi:hypothetical protein